MAVLKLLNAYNISEISVFLGVFILTLILFSVFKKITGKRYKLPPGPIGLPILGYLPFLGPKPHKTLSKLSKKYGSVISMYLGQDLVTVLNDWSSADEAYNKQETLDRPDGLFDAIPNGIGFGGENGKLWQEDRRFTVKTMRNIGLGRPEWENVMNEEVDEILEEIRKYKGQTFDVRNTLSTTFTTNIMTLMFGERLPKDHPMRLSITDSIDYITEQFAVLSWSNFLPKLCFLFQTLGLYGSKHTLNKLCQFNDTVVEFVEKELKKEGGEEKFVNIYQKEIEKNPLLSKKLLYGNTILLLFGGSETTRTATVWALMSVAKHPEVQKKIHKELDTVLGKEGEIKWSEKEKLPYTYATIMESLRWKGLVPLITLRKVIADIKVQGYDIPKGSYVFINQWAVQNDPKYWPNPRKFDPERHLTNDGKTVLQNPDSFVPFSIGKRNCPGKTIALMEIFVYFGNIMKNFTVLPPEEGIKYETLLGLTYQAMSMNLKFVPRD